METGRIDVIFSPLEYATLPATDLSRTACVVFDILRATSTMLTALENGALEIIPVSEIPEAVELRRNDSSLLLAGERGGLRIRSDQAGGVDFDFGNSPREFTPDRVRGRRIAITTTNGTRALRACASAGEIQIGGFLNLAALAASLGDSEFFKVLIVCAGTANETSLEDTLAAGALVERMANGAAAARWKLADSAQIARSTHALHKSNLAAAFGLARNGRKLLGSHELAADVAVCARLDTMSLTARMDRAGAIRSTER